MNRENKRKQYEKGYYKTHGCSDSFTCKVCGRLVVPTGAGSDHRNHCPNCLSSLHLDIEPGDREADCGGIMDPVGVWVRKNGEWAIIHRCRRCGHLSSNRVVWDHCMFVLICRHSSVPFITGIMMSLITILTLFFFNKQTGILKMKIKSK